jgi:hypothetical protein
MFCKKNWDIAGYLKADITQGILKQTNFNDEALREQKHKQNTKKRQQLGLNQRLWSYKLSVLS